MCLVKINWSSCPFILSSYPPGTPTTLDQPINLNLSWASAGGSPTRGRSVPLFVQCHKPPHCLPSSLPLSLFSSCHHLEIFFSLQTSSSLAGLLINDFVCYLWEKRESIRWKLCSYLATESTRLPMFSPLLYFSFLF